jgi:hypothetical protein
MAHEMNWSRDFQCLLNSKLGYWRGLRGRRYKCPFWADEMVFATAYQEGHRVYLDRIRHKASKGAAPIARETQGPAKKPARTNAS